MVKFILWILLMVNVNSKLKEIGVSKIKDDGQPLTGTKITFLPFC